MIMKFMAVQKTLTRSSREMLCELRLKYGLASNVILGSGNLGT